MKLIAGIACLGLFLCPPLAEPVQKKKAPPKSRKTKTKPTPPAPPAPKPNPEYMKYPVLGTWTLRRGDAEDPGTRLVFRNDASFTWIGPNFRSDGVYWYKPGKATLDYRRVDGKASAPGAIRMSIDIDEAQKGFVVDGRIFGLKGEKTLSLPTTPPGVDPPPPNEH